MNLKLNRNKIYKIGQNPRTVTIKQIDKQSNAVIDSFEVYKCIRRKNKLICYCLDAKLKLIFKNLIYAKKYKNILQKEIE